MFDIRGMRILTLALLITPIAITTVGCMSHTIESRQRIVSKGGYVRPPTLMGRRSANGAVRVGGSAEVSLQGKEPAAPNGDVGGHLIPTGQAQGFLAVQLGPNFELGISAGAFFPETRESRHGMPLEVSDQPLFTGAIEGRAIVGGRVQTSINVGMRLAQIDYSWDYLDTCQGVTCPFSFERGGRLDVREYFPSFFGGVSVDIPLNDRISLLLGGAVEMMPSLPEQKTGIDRCQGLFCSGDVPSKPPEVEAGVGVTAFAGLNIYLTEALRARLLIQPVAYQPGGAMQYLVTQGGLEYAF